jgi:hypothetical protein
MNTGFALLRRMSPKWPIADMRWSLQMPARDPKRTSATGSKRDITESLVQTLRRRYGFGSAAPRLGQKRYSHLEPRRA